MLAEEHRLRSSKDIDAVFRHGTGARNGGLLLKAKETDSEAVRVAVVVSTKVAKSAVKRNRIRRLVREAVDQELPNIRAGHDMVFVALPGYAPSSLNDVRPQVRALLNDTSILTS